MEAELGLVLGVATHKDVHVAAVLDEVGRLLGVGSFGATDQGAGQLLAWASRHGTVRRAGVEGTGSYGYRLARFLGQAGIHVLEVNRPDRSRRRRLGKSDPVDAEAAARAVLSGDARSLPKDREGPAGAPSLARRPTKRRQGQDPGLQPDPRAARLVRGRAAGAARRQTTG